MSWKNVWRNRNRSLVVIIAVTLGIISGILVVGILEGWVKQRLHDAVYNEVSHVQIHNSEYLKNEEINLTVNKEDSIAGALGRMPEVKAWSARTRIVSMLTTPWANTGAEIYGIDPEKEKQLTEIYKKVLPGGEYPDSSRHGEILISDKTAEILKLKQYIVNDEVLSSLRSEEIPENILSQLDSLKDIRYRSPKDFKDALTGIYRKKDLDRYGNTIMDKALDYRIRNKIQVTISDISGSPVQGTFRVCGIYKTTNTGFDQGTVFVNASDLAELYNGGKILIHEIAIVTNNIDDSKAVSESLTRISKDNTVSTWQELAPDAAMMNDYMVMYYFIFMGIILLALAFGIINTMMMTILERTRELGMLMAIGMNRARVFSMIMLETIFLTSVGAVIGMLAGWALISALGRTGIHFSSWGEGFEAIGFAAVVYPVLKPVFFGLITVLVIFTAIISSLWPARKALKLNPIEALRTE
jgi:ABC-type lipoprotein release transport system permease subunit